MGNEKADSAAKAGHQLAIISNFIVSAHDQVSHFRGSLRIHWQTEWERQVLQTGKGCFLRRIKTVLSHWPWAGHQSRLVETVFAKLRVGHANVSEHMYRVGKRDTPHCMHCTRVETIEHFLLICPQYDGHRKVLQNVLQRNKIPFTIINLLGGGPFDCAAQNIIISAVVTFLVSSGRIYVL